MWGETESRGKRNRKWMEEKLLRIHCMRKKSFFSIKEKRRNKENNKDKNQ